MVERTLSAAYRAIYETVRRIPRGRVATYGQIAALAGRPRHARQVGYALHALPPGHDVPWHRVINARGEISLRSGDGGAERQRRMLAREGVRFDCEGRVLLERYQWTPRVTSPKRSTAPSPGESPTPRLRGRRSVRGG